MSTQTDTPPAAAGPFNPAENDRRHLQHEAALRELRGLLDDHQRAIESNTPRLREVEQRVGALEGITYVARFDVERIARRIAAHVLARPTDLEGVRGTAPALAGLIDDLSRAADNLERALPGGEAVGARTPKNKGKE